MKLPIVWIYSIYVVTKRTLKNKLKEDLDFIQSLSNKISQAAGNDEKQRIMNHTRANVCREGKEEGPTLINQKWIFQKLHHSKK